MDHAFTLGFEQIALVGASAGAATDLRYAALDRKVDAVASLASPGLITHMVTSEHAADMVHLVRKASTSDPNASPEPDPDAFHPDMVRHDPFPVIDKISPTPLLLIQGDAGAYVSVATARQLFDAAGEPKELLILPGAGHVLRKDPVPWTRWSSS
ncbi:MAG: alpha/beta hydrolase [Actinomycetes bacterium]